MQWLATTLYCSVRLKRAFNNKPLSSYTWIYCTTLDWGSILFKYTILNGDLKIIYSPLWWTDNGKGPTLLSALIWNKLRIVTNKTSLYFWCDADLCINIFTESRFYNKEICWKKLGRIHFLKRRRNNFNLICIQYHFLTAYKWCVAYNHRWFISLD